MIRKSSEYIIMGIATMGALFICFVTYLFVCEDLGDMGGARTTHTSTACDIIFGSSEPTDTEILRSLGIAKK